MSKVRYEVSGRIAVVTMERPEVLNAMDADVFTELASCAARASADPEVRAVVVAGEGRAFSSGLDTALFAGGLAEAGPATVDIAALQGSFTAYESVDKPTIAAVQGVCFGGGLQLAIACDLRVAAEDLRMSAYEVRWGIIPDLGGTQRLPRLVGLGRAKELVMTGREVGAAEALGWGLVNRVVPVGAALGAALEWARELAAGPPLAIGAAKRLAGAALDRPVGVGLEREAAAQRRLLASEDFRETVVARGAKREPIYHAR
jgi:enoyl-CoA hydratase/carnithine racemase